jgi:hypothetical protein
VRERGGREERERKRETGEREQEREKEREMEIIWESCSGEGWKEWGREVEREVE